MLSTLYRSPLPKLGLLGLLLCLPLFATAAVPPESKLAEYSDKLDLVVDERGLQIYRMIGLKASANSLAYQQIQLKPVTVSFRKNWRRNFNMRNSLQHQIKAKDEHKLINSAAELFDQSYADALAEHSRFSLSAKPPGSKGLIIQPRVVDLVIYAPDFDQPQRWVKSAGYGTLVLEVYDGANNTLIGIIKSKKYATEYFRLHRASRVFNRAEAKRVVQRWSKQLDKQLSSLIDGTVI